MLEQALSDMGFRPRCARSSQEALEAAAAQALDFALIDLDVPGWVDLLAALRGANPEIRCCLVGASAAQSLTAEDLLSLGATCVFAKPFTLQQLRSAFNA